MSNLTLFHLYGSPNNTKVRIALGYLGLDYERVAADFQDRAAILAASGQPLTPTLQDGDRAIYDSSAILRYLDANHTTDKRLFAEDSETIHAIEAWEQRTRGGGFGQPIGILFGEFFKPERDQQALTQASELFEERCREVEQALGDNDFLVGGRLTAADCCIVPYLNFGAPTEAFRRGADSEIGNFLMDRLSVPEDCPKVRAYVARVMAHDA